MNILEPIIKNHNGKPMVSSRIVAEQLEKEHRRVMQDCREKLEDGVEFVQSSYVNSQNKEQPELLLSKDGFILLCMNYQGYNEFKRAYIQKFNEMEQAVRSKTPQTFSQALRLAAEQAELLEQQSKQLEEQAPKVLFAKSVEASQTSCLVGELAKILKQNGVNIGQNRAFAWLRQNGYLIKSGENRNLPTQRSMEMKLMEIKKNTVSNPDGSVRVTRTTKVTGKGQIYFVNLFMTEHCLQVC